MYAGVDGNPTTQGNRAGDEVVAARRCRLRPDADHSAARRLRAVLGAVQLSRRQHLGEQLRPGRLHGRTRSCRQSRTSPVTLTNPFPNGVTQPTGNALGALTNLDSNISYVDQNRTAPRVQQFSVDLQRELPGSMAVSIGYMGARTDHAGIGGSSDTAVNINQLDPAYLALGAALNDQLPNPFLGNPNVPLSLSTPATLSRARLLLPFPQYRQVNARQVTEGYSRYNAGVVELTRRMRARLGRPLQLHLQRAERQLRGRDELLHRRQSRPAGEQLQLPLVAAGVCAPASSSPPPATTRRPNTATACSTCRTA